MGKKIKKLVKAQASIIKLILLVDLSIQVNEMIRNPKYKEVDAQELVRQTLF